MFDFPEEPVPFGLPYPGRRLEWAIAVIGWSKNQFAARMDIDRGSLGQMIRGTRYVPDMLGVWVEMLAQTHLTHPQPEGWLPKPEYRDVAENCEIA